MTQLCAISGPVRDRAGNLLPNQEITFTYLGGVVGIGAGAILPEAETVTTDGSGNIAVSLYSGPYKATTTVDGRLTTFRVGVPDAASAVFAECIDQAPAVTSDLVAEVLAARNVANAAAVAAVTAQSISVMARDDAQEAADTAEAARDAIANAIFPSRANLVAVVSGGAPAFASGTVVSDGTVSYRAQPGATIIADMPGLVPFGLEYPEHHGGIGDAVDNCEGTNFRYDWTTSTAYAVGDRVQGPATTHFRRGYVCVAAHTSSNFAADLAAGRWQLGAFSGTDSRPACERILQAGRPLNLMPGRRYLWRENPLNAATPGTPFVDLRGLGIDIHIQGAPDAWIFLDERVAERLGVSGTASFGIDTGVMSPVEIGKFGVCRFHNLNVRSRWTHYPGTNLDGGQNGSGYNWCRIEGYSLFEVIGGTYEDFRQKLSRNRHNAKVRIVNTTGFRLAKGMWREVNSTDVICIGTHLDGSGDDGLDFIFDPQDVSNVNQVPGSFLVMNDNIVKASQNIQSQGFSQIQICGNVLDRMVSDAITAGSGSGLGNDRPRVAISICNNIITNTIAPWSEGSGNIGSGDNKSSILIRGGRRTSHTSAVAPGEYNPVTGAFLLPYGFMQQTKSSLVESAAGGHLIRADNNVIAKTLPDNVPYSQWGVGWMYSPVGFVNPTVTAAARAERGIIFAEDMRGASMCGNLVMGIQEAFYLLDSGSSFLQTAFMDIVISRNVVIDAIRGFAHSRSGGATTYAWSIEVSDNIFDIDPYHTSPSRTTPLNGTWVSGVSVLTGEAGIQARNLPNLSARNNRFRNCYWPIISGVSGSPGRTNVLSGNIVECNPVSDAYNAANAGVAIPGSGADYAHVIIDANPTSANFRRVLNTPASAVASVPTTGTYVRGWLLRDATGASLGWRRATTGSGHVLNTDWFAV